MLCTYHVSSSSIELELVLSLKKVNKRMCSQQCELKNTSCIFYRVKLLTFFLLWIMEEDRCALLSYFRTRSLLVPKQTHREHLLRQSLSKHKITSRMKWNIFIFRTFIERHEFKRFLRKHLYFFRAALLFFSEN